MDSIDFEKEIRNKLLIRGFENDTLLNNRALIGATIDEVILMTVKNLSIHNATQQTDPCSGNCGMNYCDDNGCIERKRILVEPNDLHEKEVKNLTIHDVSVTFTDRLFKIAYDYESSVSERMEQIKTLLVNER